MKGYIYCLSNQSMPGLLKIGFTQRNIEERLEELASPTGVPAPFELEFCVRVHNAQGLELRLHSEFQAYRLTTRREFFKLSNEEAINRILSFLSSANLEFPKPPEDSLVSTPKESIKMDSDEHSDKENGRMHLPRTPHHRLPNADRGARLNRLWNIGAVQCLFRRTGDFYMPLKRFPAALCDENGYVRFNTEEEYRNCRFLNIGIRLNVPGGIASIPGYVSKK
jgi:hypothetical protein